LWGVDWISKEFLLAACGALAIALLVLCLYPAPHQASAPQQQAAAQTNATEGETKPTQSYGDAAREWMGSVEQVIASYVKESSHYCGNDGADKEDKWLQDFVCGAKITDVTVAIFSVLLVFVTVGLLFVGWIQARRMRVTARQQLRAYVFVEETNLNNIYTPPPEEVGGGYKPTGAEITHPHFGPAVILKIKNFGQTPAYDVIHIADIKFADFPLKSKLRIPASLFTTKTALAPGGASTKVRNLPAPLSEQEIASLKAGTGAIYVYGYITYRDAFRKRRKTRFKMMYGTFTGGIGITTSMTISEDGNDSD
jgi:hypothetical protein